MTFLYQCQLKVCENNVDAFVGHKLFNNINLEIIFGERQILSFLIEVEDHSRLDKYSRGFFF